MTYPLEVRELVTEKRRARRRWQENRNPANKTIFNNLCKKLHSKIQEVRTNSLQQYLKSPSPSEATDYSLWKVTKRIKRPLQHIPPICSSSGTWARSDAEKATVCGKHVAQVFQPNPSTSAADFTLPTPDNSISTLI